MKDEIKEILNGLNVVIKHGGSVEINSKECKKIIDYITNLQERKITKEDVDKYFEENMCVSFDKFIENWKEQEEWAKYLQEENERLKEENKHIFANVNDDELLISNAMNYAEAQDYKSRCEKANNILKDTNVDMPETLLIETIDYARHILNGGDEE